VIHADFKRLLLKQMLADSSNVEQWGPIFNAAVTALSWEGESWKLDYFNSISHLPYPLHTS